MANDEAEVHDVYDNDALAVNIYDDMRSSTSILFMQMEYCLQKEQL